MSTLYLPGAAVLDPLEAAIAAHCTPPRMMPPGGEAYPELWEGLVGYWDAACGDITLNQAHHRNRRDSNDPNYYNLVDTGTNGGRDVGVLGPCYRMPSDGGLRVSNYGSGVFHDSEVEMTVCSVWWAPDDITAFLWMQGRLSTSASWSFYSYFTSGSDQLIWNEQAQAGGHWSDQVYGPRQYGAGICDVSGWAVATRGTDAGGYSKVQPAYNGRKFRDTGHTSPTDKREANTLDVFLGTEAGTDNYCIGLHGGRLYRAMYWDRRLSPEIVTRLSRDFGYNPGMPAYAAAIKTTTPSGVEITPDNALHSHVVENVTLTQSHAIATDEAVHSHVADNVTLTQAQEIATFEANHAHTADNVTLTQTHGIAAADAAHGHTMDNVTLTQSHELAVQESVHAHAADNVTLTQTHEIVANDGSHALSADNVALSVGVTIAVAEATHIHTADNVTLTQTHEIATDESSHVHAADNVTLTQTQVIATDGASHGHAVDNVILAQTHEIATDESSHGHAVDNATLTQTHVVVADDGSHAHSADNVAVSVGVSITVDAANHGHSSEIPTITEAGMLTVTAEATLSPVDAGDPIQIDATVTPSEAVTGAVISWTPTPDGGTLTSPEYKVGAGSWTAYTLGTNVSLGSISSQTDVSFRATTPASGMSFVTSVVAADSNETSEASDTAAHAVNTSGGGVENDQQQLRPCIR